jgi:hypothetical protein
MMERNTEILDELMPFEDMYDHHKLFLMLDALDWGDDDCNRSGGYLKSGRHGNLSIRAWEGRITIGIWAGDESAEVYYEGRPGKWLEEGPWIKDLWNLIVGAQEKRLEDRRKAKEEKDAKEDLKNRIKQGVLAAYCEGSK